MTRHRHQPVLHFTNRESEREVFRFSSTKKGGNVITRYSILARDNTISHQYVPAHLMFHQLKRRYNGANCKTWAGLLSEIVVRDGRPPFHTTIIIPRAPLYL